MIGEETWFIMGLGVVTFTLGWRMKKLPVSMFSAVIGIIFGGMLMAQLTFWIGLIVMMMGVYQLYEAAFKEA